MEFNNKFCLDKGKFLGVITKWRSPVLALTKDPSPSEKPINQVKNSILGCLFFP